MQVELVHKDKTRPSTISEGTRYVLVPKRGKYTIRIYNDSPQRRLAIVSVDGMNVLKLDKDGEGAGYDGPGYVLAPWQTLEIPGWRRSADKVAAFKFSAQDSKSYAEQMGRGKSNLGVVGVAVFDERQQNVWHDFMVRACSASMDSGNTRGMSDLGQFSSSIGGHSGETMSTYGCSTPPQTLSLPKVWRRKACARKGGITRTAGGLTMPEEKVNTVGTGYGKEQAFHTRSSTFERATTAPAAVLVLRYASKSQFEAWGVPLPGSVSEAASAFPAENDTAACPAPAGWRG